MDRNAPGSDNGIEQLRRLWREPGGGVWIVIFDLARIEERLECVGFSLRSYVAHLELDGDGQAQEKLLEGPLTLDELWRQTTTLLEFDRGGRQGRLLESHFWNRLAEGQAEALEAFATGDLAPRPLDAVTLRKLAFYNELRRARLGESKLYRDEAEVSEGQDHWPWGSPEELTSRAADLERPHSRPGERPRGRRPKYTAEDLVRVAAIYNAALDSGSLSPTKDVSVATGLALNAADKLVRRCRRLDPPLIAPVKRPHREGPS